MVNNSSFGLFTKKEFCLLDFKPIPPCLQQWLPIITETSKIQCRMIIPQVLDENRSCYGYL